MNVEKVTAKSLLVVGAVHVDDIAHPTQQLVARASNPVNWTRRVGGVAANAAFAAKRTRGSNTAVNFSALVGDDATAKQLEQSLTQSGLMVQLARMPNRETGRYTAIMTHEGELHIGLSDVSLAEEFTVSHLPPIAALQQNTAILMDANLSASCLEGIASLAKSNDIQLAAMSVSPIKTRRLSALANQVDLLFCNRREALAMCPDVPATAPLHALADHLQQLGFRQFVLTDGQDPLICHSTQERHTISVPTVTATHSVNGAGDALAGATFAAWATGSTLADAVVEYGLPEAASIVKGERTASPPGDFA